MEKFFFENSNFGGLLYKLLSKLKYLEFEEFFSYFSPKMTTFEAYLTGNITLNRDTDVIQRKENDQNSPRQILTWGIGGQIRLIVTFSGSNNRI